jgi:hypothetical protein
MKYDDLTEREELQKHNMEELTNLCDNIESFSNKVWKEISGGKTTVAADYAIRDVIKIANDAVTKGESFFD